MELICRLGRHGQVGRLQCSAEIPERHRQRGAQVICRTARGLEVAEVLACLEGEESRSEVGDGYVVRVLRSEDRLLYDQLSALAGDALAVCTEHLSAEKCADVLLDVEPMMDGQTLYFHFLGEPSSAVQGVVERLTGIYAEQVQANRFAQLLEHGCGPGCGTKERANCGEAGAPCAVCAMADACRK